MPNIVKNTTFPTLLDLLAPHYCRGCGLIGKPICDRCKNYILSTNRNLCPICKHDNPTGTCSHCTKNQSTTTPSDNHSITTSYKESTTPLPPTFIIGKRSDLLDAIIHDYKYHSVRSLAEPLAEMLHHRLPEELPGEVIVVPLPTIGRHIRTRGLDHTYLVAKKLTHYRPAYKVERLLLRNNNLVQVGASHQQRIAQAASAYILNPKIKPQKDVTYILLDDVWTTGASLRAATKILQTAGINKIILAILSLSILQ